MVKPDWCPQGVWDAAIRAEGGSNPALVEKIARAIMAAEKRGEEREREACAVEAEKEEYGNHIAQRVARIIATAIRNRSNTNDH